MKYIKQIKLFNGIPLPKLCYITGIVTLTELHCYITEISLHYVNRIMFKGNVVH